MGSCSASDLQEETVSQPCARSSQGLEGRSSRGSQACDGWEALGLVPEKKPGESEKDNVSTLGHRGRLAPGRN